MARSTCKIRLILGVMIGSIGVNVLCYIYERTFLTRRSACLFLFFGQLPAKDPIISDAVGCPLVLDCNSWHSSEV
ncbi:hypothetical protein EJ05DRAFT_295013 [Pseudovirgaria hyperparasitica]|uniref:Uncharacterized protein n=1 Tax=Pseudovirgaria hyperparasitica TaxID=470096 RepID=A0A6A6VTM0_9PEZI|nr:uncharacterized protein EJ05DRAFT_295013 [Pseudovirgaria hyperparasitica]KAF2752587.1 hypothetical protein EJ05DRAFT_295013 [Pseudovirgaria hyperparasitica]